MSDEDASQQEARWAEDDAPRPKGGIPKWLWLGCGGGCLLAVLAAVAAIILGVGFARKIADPEYRWGQLQEVLPHDERPEGYDVFYVPIPFTGQEQFVLTADDQPVQGLLYRVPNERALDDFFDPESQVNRGVGGVGRISDPEESTFELQGREVRALYFKKWIPESAREEHSLEGPTVRLDLTGEGSVHVAMEFTQYGDDDRVDAEDVREFLEPFDVWRGR